MSDKDKKDTARMLERMHKAAAKDASKAGWHASSSKHEQLAAKYRNKSK